MSNLILDPVIQKFVDDLAKKGGQPLYKLSYADARKLLDEVQNVSVATKPVDNEDRVIEGPNGPLNIRIKRPKGNKETLPVIVYMHGGGWILGNNKNFERMVNEIVDGAKAALVFVEYTSAPEGQFPLAHEQGYAAAKWVKEHSKELNVDSSRMVIAGDSVGGLMATAIAMMAQERGGPKFIMQLLFYPVGEANFNTASYKQFADGPWLTKNAMEWFWDAYVPNKEDRKNPLAAPLLASQDQLKHLPPALIFLNENDVLRDEGEAYAHKLIQAGVPVVAFRALGVIHDCLMLNGIAEAQPVKAIFGEATRMLSEVFEKKK